MHVCLWGLSAFLFTPTSLEFPTASHMGCLKTFWRWENQTLLSQFLPRSFLLRYGNTEACDLTVLHMFLGLAVGKLVFLLPPKGVSCAYGKNTKQK